MIIPFSPFLHGRRSWRGWRLVFRSLIVTVTICLYGAEYLLAALIVLHARVGALLQCPVGRLQYLPSRRDAVAETRRRFALLQAKVQKNTGRDSSRDGFITFVSRQSFFQATLVVGLRAELLGLFREMFGGLNPPVLVLVNPVNNPADGDDPQQEQPADDRKNDCPCFGHRTSLC